MAFRGAGVWRPLAFVIRFRFLGYEEGISLRTMTEVILRQPSYGGRATSLKIHRGVIVPFAIGDTSNFARLRLPRQRI